MSLVDQIQSLASRIATEFNAVRAEISQSVGGEGGFAKQLQNLTLLENEWVQENGLWVNKIIHPDITLDRIPQIIPVNASYDVYKAAEFLPLSEIIEQSDSTLSDGLVAAWKLEENSGVSVLDSVGSSHGVNTNATINQTGKFGKAYLFNAANSSVVEIEATDIIRPSAWNINQWTFNAWIYPTSPGLSKTVVCGPGGSGYSDSWRIYTSDSYIRFEYGDGSNNRINLSTNPVNKWSMITMMYSGTHISAYVDGVLVDSVPGTIIDKPDPYYYPMKLGYSNGMVHFDGLIDEVYWYNRPFSLTEVQALYASGNGLAYPDWEVGTGGIVAAKVYSVNKPTASIIVNLNLFPKD